MLLGCHQRLDLASHAALHAGGAAFGTYVLAATDVSCRRKEVVIWNPKKEVLVLVILTWTFQIIILCAPWHAPG